MPLFAVFDLTSTVHVIFLLSDNNKHVYTPVLNDYTIYAVPNKFTSHGLVALTTNEHHKYIKVYYIMY